MHALSLDQLHYAFGPGPAAVEGVCLAVEPGTFFALLGPSGCGKTTLLRLIAGYLTPKAGRVLLDGKEVTAQPPEHRNVGMVFQNYALFPHLTARANVAFGLEMRGVPRRERLPRVEAMLDRVGLAAAERGRYPRELSGGQQQRVAVARALVVEPRLLLLDEPLANLDRALREQLREELRALQRRTGVTTLLVTHDHEEALALADTVAVMRDGRLLQTGAPREVYSRPRTAFVARFLGDANLLEVEAVGAGVVRLRGGPTVPAASCGPPVRPGDWLVVRPEQFVVGEAAAGCAWHGPGRVLHRGFLGGDEILTVLLGGDTAVRVRRRAGDGVADVVTVGILGDGLWFLPSNE